MHALGRAAHVDVSALRNRSRPKRQIVERLSLHFRQSAGLLQPRNEAAA